MIFIDTGAFIAWYVVQDEFHHECEKTWEYASQKYTLFTSNHILSETISLLMRKTYPEFAVAKAKLLYHSEVFTILRTDNEDELEALHLFEKYREHKVDFVDCCTVALMRRHRIQKIYSYDKHFKLFGIPFI